VLVKLRAGPVAIDTGTHLGVRLSTTKYDRNVAIKIAMGYNQKEISRQLESDICIWPYSYYREVDP
jgi:hypothetical protein